ncbi:MAG: hypothetical protein ACXVZV_06880 [Terriglobales bacterium]
MAIGYAHIFALRPAKSDSGAVGVPRYQFTFTVGGNSYSKVLDEAGLQHFLLDELGLRADVVDEALKILRVESKTTIPNLEISENDATFLGMMEVGADY